MGGLVGLLGVQAAGLTLEGILPLLRPTQNAVAADQLVQVSGRRVADDRDGATEAVARQEYIQAVEANKKVAGAVPEAEVRRLILKQNEAALSIEQADMRRRIATLEARVSEARVEAATVSIERRQVSAPLDAIVLKVHHHEGEWVQAGVPVVDLIQLDRLWVEGSLKSAEYTPAEVHGRPVVVTVSLARGQKETFQGKIVFVKPVIEADDTFLVRAEIVNRQENGFWLLSPGMPADMSIQIR